jgi:uncharacterized membrane protein
MGQMTCGAIPNPEKPSLGNAAVGEMGAELCERKKQETTEEVNKPAEKSRNKQKVVESLTAMDASTLLPSKDRGELTDQGGPPTARNSPAPLENSMDIEPEEHMQQDDRVDVSQTQDPVEVSNEHMVTDQGGPSTNAPALLPLDIEHEEHMQQDDCVDVSQT